MLRHRRPARGLALSRKSHARPDPSHAHGFPFFTRQPFLLSKHHLFIFFIFFFINSFSFHRKYSIAIAASIFGIAPDDLAGSPSIIGRRDLYYTYRSIGRSIVSDLFLSLRFSFFFSRHWVNNRRYTAYRRRYRSRDRSLRASRTRNLRGHRPEGESTDPSSLPG